MSRFLVFSCLLLAGFVLSNVQCQLDEGSTKKGRCPKIEDKFEDTECPPLFPGAGLCLIDLDCSLDQKCCSDGCNMACTDPVKNITTKESLCDDNEAAAPKRGFRTGRNRIGDKMKYFCAQHSTLVGPKEIICQDNGEWSEKPPICKQSLCDDNEAAAPKRGFRTGRNRIGDKMKYFCAQHSTLVGPKEITCQDNGEWSEKPPICKHMCDEVKCDRERKCIFDANLQQTRCVCKEIRDCNRGYQPICASDGKSYQNECKMQSKSCKTQKKIKKVSGGECVPGGICAIKPTSSCYGYFEVFYYNPEKQACEEMVAGGCHESGWNGFNSVKECRSTCITSSSGPLCSRPPSPGPCKSFRMNWYHDAKENKCKQFLYGGCLGNQNNFASEEDCKRICIPSSIVKPSMCKMAVDLCERHKTSNYTLAGKVIIHYGSSIIIKITKVFKNTRKVPMASWARLSKLPVEKETSSVPACVLELPDRGELVFSGNYHVTGDERGPLMVLQEGDYIGKYLGPKQIEACTKV